MARIIEINDIHEAGPDVFFDLTGAQLMNKREPDRGLLIAESRDVIEAALEAGYEPLSFLMSRRQIRNGAADIAEACGAPIYTADDEVIKSLTGYALTKGMLCAMRRKPLPCPAAVLKNARRAAVLVGIVDPTNVGSIFRSAAALGADAVLVDPTCCDPLHRRAARVSMGAVFRVPWARLEKAVDGSLLGALREAGFTCAALALKENSVSLDCPALPGTEKLAMVFGTEGEGLPQSVIDECELTVRIPMENGMDSLNVGAAAAVTFWQVCRRVDAT